MEATFRVWPPALSLSPEPRGLTWVTHALTGASIEASACYADASGAASAAVLPVGVLTKPSPPGTRGGHSVPHMPGAQQGSDAKGSPREQRPLAAEAQLSHAV